MSLPQAEESVILLTSRKGVAQSISENFGFHNEYDDDAPGKFVTGDPDHQRQTWNFSKEETKNPSRNEGCEKLGFEPGTQDQ